MLPSASVLQPTWLTGQLGPERGTIFRIKARSYHKVLYWPWHALHGHCDSFFSLAGGLGISFPEWISDTQNFCREAILAVKGHPYKHVFHAALRAWLREGTGTLHRNIFEGSLHSTWPEPTFQSFEFRVLADPKRAQCIVHFAWMGFEVCHTSFLVGSSNGCAWTEFCLACPGILQWCAAKSMSGHGCQRRRRCRRVEGG